MATRGVWLLRFKTLSYRVEKKLTNNHGGELEALANALTVDLVGQVGETHVAHEFFTDCRDGLDLGLSKRSL